MFFILGLSVLLVALLVLNNAASLLAVLLWRITGARINRWSARRSAQTLFLLRTLPAAMSSGAVFLLFAPAYLRHESRVNYEGVSMKLGILAVISTVGIAVALVRGIATWRATRRLTADWLCNAMPLNVSTFAVPVYQVEHPFPLIAVVGVFRPRLFIATQILESLTPAELTAALAHENGHILAHDNLKRAVVRACRDLSLVSVGKDMHHAWLELSEAAADEFAARQDRTIGLDLASAIVKIARMIPAGERPPMTAGAFLATEEGARGFAARVRRLVCVSESVPQGFETPSVLSRLSLMIPAALTLLIGFMTFESHVLSAIHGVIEHAVCLLD